MLGAVQRAVEAPGLEFGPTPLAVPGMVFQKGVPMIRRLISRQIPKATMETARGAEVTAPVARVVSATGTATLAEKTPLVQKNLQKIQKMKTGRPATIVGFRAEAAGGPVPGRGIFFGATPGQARSFIGATPFHARPKTMLRSGGGTVRRFDVLKFENPLVTEVGFGQHQLMEQMLANPERFKLSGSMQRVGQRVLGRIGAGAAGEAAFTRMDKWIARAARNAGFDGILYKDKPHFGGQIVDLAGTVTKKVK